MRNFIFIALTASVSACGEEPVSSMLDATALVDVPTGSDASETHVTDAAVDVSDASNDLGR